MSAAHGKDWGRARKAPARSCRWVRRKTPTAPRGAASMRSRRTCGTARIQAAKSSAASTRPSAPSRRSTKALARIGQSRSNGSAAVPSAMLATSRTPRAQSSSSEPSNIDSSTSTACRATTQQTTYLKYLPDRIHSVRHRTGGHDIRVSDVAGLHRGCGHRQSRALMRANQRREDTMAGNDAVSRRAQAFALGDRATTRRAQRPAAAKPSATHYFVLTHGGLRRCSLGELFEKDHGAMAIEEFVSEMRSRLPECSTAHEATRDGGADSRRSSARTISLDELSAADQLRLQTIRRSA